MTEINNNEDKGKVISSSTERTSEVKDVNEDNISRNPDRYQKIKFPSLVGFTLTGFKDGKLGIVTTQVNCKDRYTPEAILHFTQSTLDDLIYPEVINRARHGILPIDFKLRNAHVLMYPDESKNEVLFNEDVRFLAKILTEDGKEPMLMQKVKANNIRDVLGLYPGINNDQNAAHIMLLRIKDKWYFASNFVYNVGLCKEKISQSKDFFRAAELAMDSKLLASFIDALYSSTELAIQACLLPIHRGKFSLPQNQKHPSTMVELSAFSDAGNLDSKYKKHLENLHMLRLRGRYQRGNPNKKFDLEDSVVKKLSNLTKELINHVGLLLSSAENSRNPKPGAGGYLLTIGQ